MQKTVLTAGGKTDAVLSGTSSFSFSQSFSFRFLEFYISAVKKNDLSFCFPDVDSGITRFSGF